MHDVRVLPGPPMTCLALVQLLQQLPLQLLVLLEGVLQGQGRQRKGGEERGVWGCEINGGAESMAGQQEGWAMAVCRALAKHSTRF